MESLEAGRRMSAGFPSWPFPFYVGVVATVALGPDALAMLSSGLFATPTGYSAGMRIDIGHKVLQLRDDG